MPILFDLRSEIREQENIEKIHADIMKKLSKENIDCPLIYNDTWLLNRFTNKVMPFVLDPKTEFFAPAIYLDFSDPQACLAEIDALETDTVILKNVEEDNGLGIICIPKQQMPNVFDILTNNNTQAIDKLDIDATAKLHLRLNCYLLHSAFHSDKTIIAMPLIESKRLTYNGQGYRATGRTSVMVIKNDNQYEISHINSAWQLPPNSFTDTTTASIISNESGYHVLPMEDHDQQLVLNVLQRFFETNGEFLFLDKFYPWFKQKLDANDPVVRYVGAIEEVRRIDEPISQEILRSDALMKLPNYALFIFKMLSNGEIPEIKLSLFKEKLAKLADYEVYEACIFFMSKAKEKFLSSTNEDEISKYNAFVDASQEVYRKREPSFEYLTVIVDLAEQFAQIGNEYVIDLLKHYTKVYPEVPKTQYTERQADELWKKVTQISENMKQKVPQKAIIYWQPLKVSKPSKILQQTKDISPEEKLALYCQWLAYYAAEPNTPYASIVITLSNIAMCYSKLEDFINAQRYFEIVVECFQKTEETTAAINQSEKKLARLGSYKKSISALIAQKTSPIEKPAISEQEQQELQKKYKLTDMNKPQLEKGLRNAAANGYKDDLIKFIQLGANIDASDMKHNKTALHHAVLKEHDECAKTLINCGAKYQLKDSSGMTAYDYAKEKRSTVFAGVALDKIPIAAMSEGKEELRSEVENLFQP